MAELDADVIIREGTVADAAPLAILSGQLGYPSTPAQVVARFAALVPRADWALYVAERDDAVIGSIFVTAVLSIQRDPTAEIGGLIVAEGQRGQGVGELLVDAAEAWARGHGFAEMVVHSNVLRRDAHRFYQRLGYTIVKAQQYFHKEIA